MHFSCQVESIYRNGVGEGCKMIDIVLVRDRVGLGFAEFAAVPRTPGVCLCH